MSIESQTPAVQLDLRQKCAIASKALQTFAQDATVRTAAQAVGIDAALVALQTALVAAGAGPVLPATQVIVSNGATVNVENSAGALDSPATAVVAGGVLTGVNLGATKTIVTHADSINVENSAGALDSPATAVVAAGVISGVNLAATKTILTNALKFSGVTITGSGTFFTPTVAAGVLTGGVLSAS